MIICVVPKSVFKTELLPLSERFILQRVLLELDKGTHLVCSLFVFKDNSGFLSTIFMYCEGSSCSGTIKLFENEEKFAMFLDILACILTN